jgi:hypothetical protein
MGQQGQILKREFSRRFRYQGTELPPTGDWAAQSSLRGTIRVALVGQTCSKGGQTLCLA